MPSPDAARPAHRSPRLVGLVAGGGALGAVARAGVAQGIDGARATFVVNVVGAFVLGCLLEALTRGGPDVGARRTLRLVVGTGFCGAFTTYSTFAHDVVERPMWGAAGWGIAQVVAGVLAAACGAVLASLIAARRADRTTPQPPEGLRSTRQAPR